MSIEILTGVSPRLESLAARQLEDAPGVSVIRRCADLAEVLSTAAAGLGAIVVVSADLRGLDRESLRQLAGAGVRVAGLVEPGDDEGERRLRQLGLRTVLRSDADPVTVAEALGELHSGGLAEATPTASEVSVIAPESSSDAVVPDPADAPHERPPGRITCVWGPTGAPGRTTVAVTLAAHLAARGVRVLLVDLDTWGASIAQVLALIDEAPGVAAAARASELGQLDVAALARIAPEAAPSLRVLTGLPKPERWPELRPGAVEDLLDHARRLVDHVIVDCGFALEDDEELSYDTVAPRRNAATLTALGAADRVLAVGAGDPVGLQRLVRGVQDLAQVLDGDPVVVVNKVRATVAGAHPERAVADVLGRFAGLSELVFLPWAPEDCDAALLHGRSLVEHRPQSPLTLALARLADQLEPSAVLGPAPAPATRRGRRAG